MCTASWPRTEALTLALCALGCGGAPPPSPAEPTTARAVVTGFATDGGGLTVRFEGAPAATVAVGEGFVERVGEVARAFAAGAPVEVRRRGGELVAVGGAPAGRPPPVGDPEAPVDSDVVMSFGTTDEPACPIAVLFFQHAARYCVAVEDAAWALPPLARSFEAEAPARFRLAAGMFLRPVP